MPYASQAQRGKFHAMANRGEISQRTVNEFDEASRGKKLPKRKKPTNKISPTSSQVHVPSTGEDEQVLVKTKGGTTIEVGKWVKKDELTTEGRKHVAAHNFALPETKDYPIHDISHARNALARVSQHGSSEEKAKVRAAVYRKFPSLRPVSKSDGPRRVASVAVRHGNHILMGKRRDNGKWTTPGGHLEPDEDFPTGAMRELLEETGIEGNLDDLKSLSDIHKVSDKEGKPLHVQPFKIDMSERPQTSMMDDPDSEVQRWQWVDISQGLPKDIAGNMHTPPERNCLMKALGLAPARPSEADSSDQMYPQLDNLESEMLKSVGYDVRKEEYEDNGGERYRDDNSNAQDSNTLDQMYSYQLLVEGMDWELEHTTVNPDQARENAIEMLEEDPMHYRKLNMNQDGTDDVLAKDLNENDQNPWEPRGLSIDLGSGPNREEGHIGFDTYPYDHGTVVHDLEMGIPVPDSTVQNARLCNVPMDDDTQKHMLSEIHRVLMPGGQFVYEGPNDIYNYPDWLNQYPGLVLVDHESNVPHPEVQKEGPGANVHRQTFTRVATPDPATANDAEPRIGVAAYDWLPEDALLAMDAMSYYYSDATSSGRGNRLHGYPSQGALFNQQRNNATKESDSSGSGDSNQKVKSIRFFKRKKEHQLDLFKDLHAAGEDDSSTHDMSATVTPEQEDVSRAFNRTNPNPPPPKKLSRGISKILKSDRIVPIFKANAHKQIVYAVVLAPNEIDSQDDFMEPEEIEKAAHKYLMNSRVVGSGHSKPIKAHPVESFIAPQDFGVSGQYGDQTVKKGSWVLGVKIDDPDEWQKVLDGEYQGFSVGGFGLRDEV